MSELNISFSQIRKICANLSNKKRSVPIGSGSYAKVWECTYEIMIPVSTSTTTTTSTTASTTIQRAVIAEKMFFPGCHDMCRIEYDNRVMIGPQDLEGIVTFYSMGRGTIQMRRYRTTLFNLFDLPYETKVKIFPILLKQLLVGVSHLDRKSLTHCDISPKNIFVDHDNMFSEPHVHAVLGDLGSVSHIDDKKKDKKGIASTHKYASPEIRAKSHRSTKSDTYSIAICFLEFLGKPTNMELEMYRSRFSLIPNFPKRDVLIGMIEPRVENRIDHKVALERS